MPGVRVGGTSVIVPGGGVAIGASGRRGRAAAACGGAAASRRWISRTVSGMSPGLDGGAWAGPAGGGAWEPVRSRSWAAVTAQIARAAMTSTVCRRTAV